MTRASDAGWLLVIDMQPAFAHPESPWFTPGLDAVADRIATMVPLFGQRVVFTRFVPPATPSGSWQAYYRRWPFAHEAGREWLWTLHPRLAGGPSFASHRFSKWLPELQTHLGPEPTVSLCGVSTDCCVLATALAAVDDGAHVRLIADLCAANTPGIHERALAIMAARAPQLAIVTLAGERARQLALAQESPA